MKRINKDDVILLDCSQQVKGNRNVSKTSADKELEDEIESQREMLQIYLASDMDIDKMDYNDVVNYAINDVNEQNVFIGHWKDYAFLRGKLKGRQEARKEIMESDTIQKEIENKCLKSYNQALEEFEKIIDKCKIHTAGALILIEKKELLNKLKEKK